MDDASEARALNLSNWESRVPHHLAGYRIEPLLADPQALSGVVAFDRARLGDIAGLDVVHLQCHIGTDTISLARLGARVTGLDFSPSAIVAARDLAAKAGADVEFVVADVDDAPAVLGGEKFDLVYTGIGALCWLPNIRRWATVVAALLRPGGRLFIREGHPVMWSMSDPREDGLLVIEYPYFETPEGTRFEIPVSYVYHEGELDQPTTIEFNHGLGEIVTALLDEAMRLTALEEHRSVPWPASATRWWKATMRSSASAKAPSGCPSATPCRRSRIADPIPLGSRRRLESALTSLVGCPNSPWGVCAAANLANLPQGECRRSPWWFAEQS